MFYTPSTRNEGHIRRTSTPTRPHRPTSQHYSPSRDSRLVASPTFVLLHSPYKSSLGPTAPLSSRNTSLSDSDAYSDDDDENNLGDSGNGENVFRSPTTPGTCKKNSIAPAVNFSLPRRPKALRSRISTTPVSAKPIPAARFTMTTPDSNTDWRSFAGSESMTKLSIHDLRESGAGLSGARRERKRTESSSSYMPARHRKTSTPPSSIGPSSSSSFTPDKLFFASQKSPLSSRNRQSVQSVQPASPDIPRALPPLFFDTTNLLSPSSHHLVLSNGAGSPFPSSFNFTSHQPSSSDPSISTSTSNASSNFSFDDIKPLQAVFKPAPISRKFKPRDSGISGLGTDESDGGSGIGDASCGSFSSLSNVEEDVPLTGSVDPLADPGEFNLVTPTVAPEGMSGWPKEPYWVGAGVPGSSRNLDADQLLLHMERIANGGGAVTTKRIMPDTPMKKHPAKARTWQSTGKSFSLGSATSASNTGTLRAAPRKSLPSRLPDFRPESPESDPSPSKLGTSVKPRVPSRRKSYGTVGRGRADTPIVHPINNASSEGTQSPLSPRRPALPLFGRAELLRRPSSSAFSSNSEFSGEGSMMGTPTKRNSIPMLWKAPDTVAHLSTKSPDSVFGDSPGAEPLPSLTSLFANVVSPMPLSSLGAPRKSVPNLIPRPLSANSNSHATPYHPHTSKVLAYDYPKSPLTPTVSILPKVSAAPSSFNINKLHSAKTYRPSLAAPTATPSRPPPRRDPVPIERAKSPSLIPSHPAVARARGSLPAAGVAGSSSLASRLARRSGGELGLAIPGAKFKPARNRTKSDVGTRGLRLDLDDMDMEFEGSIRRSAMFSEVEVPIDERPGYFESDFVKPAEANGILGKGAFGRVFRVKAKVSAGDGTAYAVKVSKQYDGDRHRARLLEEVDALRHLQASPRDGYDNILHYVDAWEEDRTLYIQTELCELGNLGEFLSEFGRSFERLDESRLWKIFAEIARGISHIHTSGIIHLDLKPANIFVTQEGRLRIGDFGMATRWPRLGADATSTTAGNGFEREGDREYMAAEILVGKYGPEADMFSFGMLMLEAAENIVVPSNGDAWHRLRQDDFSEVHLTGISKVMSTLIYSLMASDPSRRPNIQSIMRHTSVSTTLAIMKRNRVIVIKTGTKLFRASAFISEPSSFLEKVIGKDGVATISKIGEDMDLS